MGDESLPDSASVYHITNKNGLYSELLTLLIALQGVATTTEYLMSGESNYKPGDYLTVEAKFLGMEVRLPLFGPIQAAIQGQEPDKIDITVVHKKAPKKEYVYQVTGLQRFVDAIFKPFLVSYHERHKKEIQKHFPAGRTTWPEAWQMSWAIRNATSHNGIVFKHTNQKPISWRGFQHNPIQDKSSPILSRVNGGDLLILLLEMEDVRRSIIC